MKTILLLLSLCLPTASQTLAQVFVDNVNINEQDIVYCQLIGVNAEGLTGTRIWIDYGQPKFVVDYLYRQTIAGRDRQRRKFNTVMDALNFMIYSGWELVSSHVTTESSTTKFVYLLRKRLE